MKTITLDLRVKILGVLLLGCGLGFSIVNGQVSVCDMQNRNPILFVLSSVCTILGLTIMCKIFCNFKIMRVLIFLGRHSLVILGTHWSVMVLVTHFIKGYIPIMNRTYIKIVVILVIEAVIIQCGLWLKRLSKRGVQNE